MNADKALLVGAKALLHRDVTRVWSQARSLQMGKAQISKWERHKLENQQLGKHELENQQA